jgi:DNA-binding NarL/FixJ family response regulator
VTGPTITSRWPAEDEFARALGVRIEELTVDGEPWGMRFHRTPQPPPCPLTLHEVEILRMVSEGTENPEIAEALGIALDTVKAHLRNVTRKLGARGRANAVLIALRAGWLK